MKYKVNYNDKIIDAIKLLELSGYDGAVGVVRESIIISVITDGDIRRAILSSLNLDSKIEDLLMIRGLNFIYVIEGEESKANELFNSNKKIRQIPVLNEGMTEITTFLHRQTEDKKKKSVKALIMAGGKGTRLRPYTLDCPKPLLPVKGKPMITHNIEWFLNYNIDSFYISVNYLKNKIIDHYKDKNYNIKFLEENKELGTIGCVSMIDDVDFDIIVVKNGDVFCEFNLEDALKFHNHHLADITVITKKYEHLIPFGVMKTNSLDFIKLKEKPLIEEFINTGIYIINTKLLSLVKKDFFNATDLLISAKNRNKVIKCFPINDEWNDVGTVIEYEKIR